METNQSTITASPALQAAFTRANAQIRSQTKALEQRYNELLRSEQRESKVLPERTELHIQYY